MLICGKKNPNRDLLQQYGVRVFIVGKRDLLPQDVKDACDEIEAITAHNTRSVAPLALLAFANIRNVLTIEEHSTFVLPTQVKMRLLLLSDKQSPLLRVISCLLPNQRKTGVRK